MEDTLISRIQDAGIKAEVNDALRFLTYMMDDVALRRTWWTLIRSAALEKEQARVKLRSTLQTRNTSKSKSSRNRRKADRELVQ